MNFSSQLVGRKPSITILGAGIAGIAAANLLPDSVILEANNRVGGRIKDKYGATWFHGFDNRLAQKAINYGFKLHEDHEKILLFPQNQDQTSHRQTCFSLRKKLWEHSVSEDSDMTLESFLKAGNDYEQDTCELLFGLLDAGTPTSQISTYDYESSFIGAYGYIPLGGMEQFVNKLAEELILKNRIKFNSPVHEIREYQQGYLLTMADGTKHYTDQLIVTCSVGVLNSGAIKFSPELPMRKKEALSKIEMCQLNKFFIEFEEGFFLKHPVEPFTHCHVIRPDHDPLLFVARPEGESKIMGLIGGPLSAQLEQAGEHAVNQYFIDALSYAYQENIAPFVKRIEFTSWNKDPLFCGSYSFVNVGNSWAREEVYEIPVAHSRTGRPGIYFAGEASPINTASVAGAFDSGERTAQKIIELSYGQQHLNNTTLGGYAGLQNPTSHINR